MGSDVDSSSPERSREGLSQQQVGFAHVLCGQLCTVPPLRLLSWLCRDLLAHKGPAHSQCAG